MNLGSYGENLARKFLEKKGFKIIEKNFKTPRWGEIDLVMKDGDTLVFVEVKTRKGSAAELYGGPLGSVNYYKMRAIQRAAQFYIRECEIATERKRGQYISYQGSARLDAVAIIVPDEGEPDIEHFPNISKL